MTSHAPCPSTNVYPTTAGEAVHPSLTGHMPLHQHTAGHGYPSAISGHPGALYGPAHGQMYTGHTQAVGSETAAQRYMAALSADYQAASLQTTQPHARYYGNHAIAAHPYGAIHPGYDMTAFRRKAATRETTNALKAWLREHKTNPYPTKGDKIMLAMISRMTLTQVSTWFANARRRLKKDKTTSIHDSLSGTEDDKPDNREDTCSSRVPNYYGEHTKPTIEVATKPRADDVTPPTRPAKKCVQRLFSPDARTDIAIDNSSSPESNYGTEIISHSLQANYEIKDVRLAPTQLPPISTVTPYHSNAYHSNAYHDNATSSTSAISSNVGSQKSKIWSIHEIIGTKPATSDSEGDDVNVSRDSDSYYSEESSFVSQSGIVYAQMTCNSKHTEPEISYL